ncbi:growth-regulated alpha protein isoform X3 [Microcaecilia unicolor]|uniref:C-X-C motif chemokine n=1 Tax=Microcaecilia unicolor TaxID=1415580 RepID=A0A6P7YLR0_9AMPH|nr:growth-regulated alpha protein-like isoform X3 [Microcaecilia unicolor]
MVNRSLMLSLLVLYVICIQGGFLDDPGCSCVDLKEKLVHVQNIQNIKIVPASSFCEDTEIIVRQKNGIRYCLNPQKQKIWRSLQNLTKSKNLSAMRTP